MTTAFKPRYCHEGHFTVHERCSSCEALARSMGIEIRPIRPRTNNKQTPPIRKPRGTYRHHHINESGVTKAEDKRIAAEWAQRPTQQLNENQILLAAQRSRVARDRAAGIKVVLR